MNPLLQQALYSILRFAMASAATYLVEHGVWTAGDASSYVGAAALAVLTLAWSVWEKYKTQVYVKLLKALHLQDLRNEAARADS